MKKRLLKTGAIFGAMLFGAATFAGCGGTENKEGCLNVFCMEAGYGVEWCDDLLKLFIEQEWVKEKYGDVTYNFQHNDQKNFVESKLKAGAKNNQFDLLFGEINQTYINVQELCEELTEDVYRKTIPGENITYEEKCFDSYNQTNRFLDGGATSEGNRYYVASWAGGMNGIFYNEDLLNSLGVQVPRTTEELKEICKTVLQQKGNTQGLYGEGYSFVLHQGLPYLSYLFPVWWAQYEGIDGYTNFYNGIDDGMISVNIFKQQGRLKALQVYEDLFFYDETNAYLDPASNTYEYMTAQTRFLQGHGVFHVNGDWFENEMSEMKADIVAQTGIDYTIKLMRTPIISSLGEKLGITETELRNTVDYVDGKTTVKPSYENLRQGYTADTIIRRVSDARGIVNASGPYHTSVVPAYAKDKDLAKDFLLFMASDVALEQYIKTTNGASLPFTYNVKEKSPETYEQLTVMQKARLDYFNDANIEIEVLPNQEAFPLVRFGGVSAFSISNFTTIFSSADNKKTALDIYNDTIEAWNIDKWNQSCQKAGI